MEQTFYILLGIGIYYGSRVGATPWITKQCMNTAATSDCSGLNLQILPDNIPDSIQSLDFSFNVLPALYNSTFQRLRSLITLDLTRCSINYIYEDVFFYQFDLERLILVANPLSFISDSAFPGPLALKYISLAGSRIRSLKDIPVARFEFLETLDLGASDIQSLDGLENLPLQQMKRLVLDLNVIEMIQTSDTEKLQRTNKLELSFKGNKLVEVEARAFQNLVLDSLDFSGCFNKMNMSALLKGLEGVKTNKLYLGVYEESPKSYVTSAELQAFCNVSASDLNFQLQHFRGLTDTSFRCFSEIQKLDFTRAHLNELPSSSTNLSLLSHLVLDENLFTNLCDINAGNFPMLTHLSVRGNQKLLAFHENCLEPLSHLEELQLSHSDMLTGDSCCTKQLTGLGELKFLNLSYNFHMNWEPLPFNATPNLQNLDFAYTKYVRSSSSPFSNLEKLHTLNLSFTNTNVLENVQILKGLNQLRVLNLRGNPAGGGIFTKIKTFEYVPLLEDLDLSSCEITEIHENVLEDLPRLQTVDFSDNLLVRLGPVDFHSPNQIQLDFSSNKIALVDIRFVEDLGRGSRVDLSSNPLACNCTNYQFLMWAKDNVSKMKQTEKTTCEKTKEKVVDLNLRCVVSTSALGVVLGTAGGIVILAALVYFRRTKHTPNRNYTIL